MYEMERRRLQADFDGNNGRRDMPRGLLALGASAALTGTLPGMGSTSVFAADFDAMLHKGTALKLPLNKPPIRTRCSPTSTRSMPCREWKWPTISSPMTSISTR